VPGVRCQAPGVRLSARNSSLVTDTMLTYTQIAFNGAMALLMGPCKGTTQQPGAKPLEG
jgi:hypothetical protein